ncbi:fumarylacetoacetate hydrolase family protein [Rhizobium changzhiense]|uniref:fumarylacetoacetate hydrolase family protein n=1 Tax=Rhizobium TaxID=379 RepID=UPI00144184A8|nr:MULTISPECIES: fumarylacetoacetate hydrolase family protein [Rhizobium]MCH4549487.1 fumarylacetoacetate hydrolase family protein [Rhizobium changzhiense]NKN01103.1 hydrolase [Rhizobium leguminosarum bv. viciae]
MKLATIIVDGQRKVVVIDPSGERYTPAAEAFPDLAPSTHEDMVSLIAEIGRQKRSAPLEGSTAIAIDDLLPPITNPPHNVFCVGKNYHAHAHEFTKSGFDAGATAAEAIPEHPIIFTKPSSSLARPFGDIPLWPGLDEAVDYEAELAVVIGKAGRFITAERALDHVFGYTVFNDVTARDLQKKHKQWFLGKGIDGFGPIGPWIVTKDELDIANVEITCTVNGEERQKTSTKDLIFDIPTLIEVISRSVTLLPGDIIATGTPAGVAIGFEPPRFLKDGDKVVVSIEGIGQIANTARLQPLPPQSPRVTGYVTSPVSGRGLRSDMQD